MTIGDYVLKADPMSSPIVRDEEIHPLEWRHVSQPNSAPLPGVGDDRLRDIVRGQFGAGYAYYETSLLNAVGIGQGNMIVLDDRPLDVTQQFDEMMTCSMAGWAEVIRTFGQYDGGYGA